MGKISINITINYVGLDGEVHRGTTRREKYINPKFKDPENGEYYGEQFLENGKKKIRIISKGDFLASRGESLGLRDKDQNRGTASQDIPDKGVSGSDDDFLFLHPDTLDPDKEFFDREGAQSGERAKVRGCAFFAIIFGAVLAYYFPILGVPLIIVSILAVIGTIGNEKSVPPNLKTEDKRKDSIKSSSCSQSEKQTNIADKLSSKCIGIQSDTYYIFRESYKCEDSKVRKLEITYFAASLLKCHLNKFATIPNMNGVFRDALAKVFSISIPTSGESISINQAFSEYDAREKEYLALLYKTQPTTVQMHLYERVINPSNNDVPMIKITFALPLFSTIEVKLSKWVKSEF
jgi:hypothetical protein